MGDLLSLTFPWCLVCVWGGRKKGGERGAMNPQLRSLPRPLSFTPPPPSALPKDGEKMGGGFTNFYSRPKTKSCTVWRSWDIALKVKFCRVFCGVH